MAGPRQLPPPLLLLLCALAVPPSGVAQHQPADDSCPPGAATTTAGCPAALPLAAALADNTPPTAALDALIFPLNRSHFLRRVWERRPHHFRQRRPADANAGLIGDAEDSFAGGGAGIEAFLSGLVSTSQEVRVSKMKADATRENNLRINAERRVVFDRHDTDHDGTLSRDEVLYLTPHLHHVAPSYSNFTPIVLHFTPFFTHFPLEFSGAHAARQPERRADRLVSLYANDAASIENEDSSIPQSKMKILLVKMRILPLKTENLCGSVLE